MKIKIFASLVALSVLLFSCSKKGPDEEGNKAEDTKALEAKIIGKWSFNNVSLATLAVVRSSAALKGKGLFTAPSNQLLPSVSVTSLPTPSNTGFIEFLSGNTYIIYDNFGAFFSGKFEVKDGSSISLAGFGSISEIRFNDQKINFKINYAASGKSIEVMANKAAEIAATDKTKLLCAHTWYVTDDEDGKSLVGNTIDRATILFSLSGTYLVQFFKSGKLVEAKVANWKWHTTDPNKIVYWWDDDLPNENTDYVLLRELTNSILKTREELNSNPVVYNNFVLKPVQ
jgi:hypothetical protein